LIEQLVNSFEEAGSHEVIWDASNESSGIYILSIEIGNECQTQKLVLVK
jgi:hypothetical protein